MGMYNAFIHHSNCIRGTPRPCISFYKRTINIYLRKTNVNQDICQPSEFNVYFFFSLSSNVMKKTAIEIIHINLTLVVNDFVILLIRVTFYH